MGGRMGGWYRRPPSQRPATFAFSARALATNCCKLTMLITCVSSSAVISSTKRPTSVQKKRDAMGGAWGTWCCQLCLLEKPTRLVWSTDTPALVRLRRRMMRIWVGCRREGGTKG